MTEMYRVGGAQAVAALAYGTASIAAGRQDLRARQYLRGAGETRGVRRGRYRQHRRARARSSCLRTIAADPAYIAADMLSQAEHDEMASAVLVTPSRAAGRRGAAEVERQLASAAARRDRSQARWSGYGAILLVDSWTKASTS